MRSDQLNTAINAVEKLSLKDQDIIAKKILEEIEAMEWDEKWDETLVTPESEAFLDKLEEEAKADRATGKSVKYTPGKSLAELFQQQI